LGWPSLAVPLPSGASRWRPWPRFNAPPWASHCPRLAAVRHRRHAK